jgi:RecB family exonuclease/inactivated superfamily I helicase
MNIQRVFLDWKRPALAAAVDYLFEQFATAGQLDLEQVVLALPGSRAGRRLLEILVAEAQRRQLPLCPPRIVTVGELPELLYEAKRPFADTLVQQLAWNEALRKTDPRHVEMIVKLPSPDDRLAWLSLGEMLGRVHRELAADGLDFSKVAQCGSQIDGFRETARWQALAEVQKQYLATLDGLDLWDRQTARLVAIEKAECRTEKRIVLVGATDLNRSQRKMLDLVAEHVTALVFAPKKLAERFDEHGCISPAAWLAQEIPLSDEQMEVADDAAGQAEAVVRAIAALDGRYNTEQIAIGMADEQIVPHVLQRLRQCGLPARHGVGTTVARSAPFRLLAAMADYLENASFSALAALVRHPWVHQWLLAKSVPGDWLSQLDAYQGEHMPSAMDGQWQGDDQPHETIQRVYKTVQGLCRSLQGKARPLTEWAEPIVELLAEIFGRQPLRSDAEPDRTILDACDQVHEALAQQLTIPAELMPAVTSIEALRLVLRQIDGGCVPPPPDRGAMELLGWLELPLDDAPALVVTGFNEGRVPASLNADVFLPNQLRRALEIEDNDRRYARDAYALSLLAASRESLQVIAGRRSAEGDPLLPSRLLFTCNDTAMARRVTTFFDDEKRPARPRLETGRLCAGRERSLLEVPRPLPLATPITSMRVTEFKDYLGCPYRYYLRHVLKLESLADSAEELDGAGFGSLAHEVLSSLGQDPDVAAAPPEMIAKYLGNQLDAAVLASFGKAPLPSVRVQVEQLRLRLAAFARWQAEWARHGWRIEYTEVSPESGKAFLEVDGQRMLLRGRIDRIDVNAASGQRVIFDYKTSDRATSPKKAHQKSGEWIDLQLPLYRHLVTGLGISGPLELAYIVLPKDITAVGRLAAEWTADEFQAADEAAAGVIRNVRAEKFWPPANPPPAFSEDFAAICQDNRFAAAIAQESAEGGSQP